MMKKRVRIYKPANKFQEGGSQGSEQYTDEQLLTFILQTLSQPDGTIEEAQQKLLQSNIDPNRIMKLSKAATDYVDEQEDIKRAKMSEDEESLQDIEANQALEEEQAQQQAARDQRMQQMYESEVPDIDEGGEDETAYMAYGGSMSKSKFIKSYIKLAKKAEGGNTSDDTDIPVNGRAEGLNKFIGAVKTTAEDAALREQAEQAYEQQMDMSYAQFGGGLFHGSHARRAAKQLNRMMPAGIPNQSLMQFIPQNSFPGGVTLANIDVRRTGLFGRPKEYTINFNTAPLNYNTIKDVVDLEKNNIKETQKDISTEKKSNETNTSTDKNAVVTTTVNDDPITFSNGNKVTEEVSSKSTTVKPANKKMATITPVIPEAVDYSAAPFENVLGQRYDNNIYNTGNPTKIVTPKAPARSNYFENSPWAYKSVNSYKQAPSPWERELELRYLNQKRMHFQAGGFTDEQSGLYKFLGGGEDLSMPQLDIDYANSKNTADPYFAEGGLYRYQGDGASETKVDYSINPVTGKAWTNDEWNALSKKQEESKATSPFSPEQEAWFQQHYGNVDQQQTSSQYGYPSYGYNPYLSAAAPGFFGGNAPVSYAGSWSKLIGAPYMTGTDNPAMNLIGPNTRISSIDVKKTGMLSHRPKKYTVNFSNYLDNTAPIFTDKPGPGVSDQAETNDKVLSRREAIKEADQQLDKINEEVPTSKFQQNPDLVDYEGAGPESAPVQRPGMTDEEIAMSAPPNAEELPTSVKDWNAQYSTKERAALARSSGLAAQNRQNAMDQFGDMVQWGKNENAIQEQMPRESNMLLHGYNHQYNPMEHIQTGAFTPGYDLPNMEHYNSDNDIRLNNVENAPITTFNKKSSPVSSQRKQISPKFNKDLVKENPNSYSASERRYKDYANSSEGRERIRAMHDKAKAERTKQKQYTEPATSAQVAPNKTKRELDRIEDERRRRSQNYSGQDELSRIIAQDRKRTRKAAHGGALDKADVGEEVTVYTSRPEFAGISNVQMTQKDVAPKTEFTAPQGSTFNWSGFSNQEVPQNNQQITDKTALATMNTQIDSNQANRDNLAKSTKTENWSADFKTKNSWNIDPQAALNTFNAAANTGLGWIENYQNAKANNNQLAQYMSDNLNASNARRDRGRFDVNSGLENVDRMGFTGVTAAYGGMFEYGGSYQEGGEAYMTQEEIDDFIANGGELEYLND